MQGSQEARENLLRALLLLQMLWQANERPRRKVALAEFYNAPLSDAMDVQAEYIAWRQIGVSDGIFPPLHLQGLHLDTACEGISAFYIVMSSQPFAWGALMSLLQLVGSHSSTFFYLLSSVGRLDQHYSTMR